MEEVLCSREWGYSRLSVQENKRASEVEAARIAVIEQDFNL